MLFSSLFAIALAITLPLTLAQKIQDICENPQVVSTGTAGKNGEVLVEYLRCANTIQKRSPGRLFQRQAGPAPFPISTSSAAPPMTTSAIDVCDAPCETNCFPGDVGTGPNPNDCAVIADTLLQNAGVLLLTDPATNSALFTLQFQSCKTFFLNQADVALEYCSNDFGTLVNFIALNCQAQQNAHGGNCVADDQLWFVQVQHS